MRRCAEVLCFLLQGAFSDAMRAQGAVAETQVERQKPPLTEWHPGTFGGVTAGRSTSRDVVRAMGEPPYRHSEDDGEQYVYERDDGSYLRFFLNRSTSIVGAIVMDRVDLTKEDVLRMFGDDFIIRCYYSDGCLSDGEASPQYESPDGNHFELQYPERGVAIGIDSESTVIYISYRADVSGTKSSRCERVGHSQYAEVFAAPGAGGHDIHPGGWQPATFMTLEIGQSSADDMRRALGNPDSTWTVDGPRPQEWFEYEVGGEVPGDAIIVVDESTRRITGVDVYPKASYVSVDRLTGRITSVSVEDWVYTETDVTSYFGDDYVMTRYDFDTCFGPEDEAPLYESEAGELEFMEFRSRGIAALVTWDEKLYRISFLAGPLGAPSSRCPAEENPSAGDLPGP